MNRRFFSPQLFRQPQLRLDAALAATAEEGVAAAQRPMHEPPLEPRDEAVFLLTAAAEVEHALMVQYLYAAYSLRVTEGSDPQLGQLQELLLQIAREEMGHLATVQNLLLLIGGPLNFNREHSPYASEIYPFRFKLEALTLDSLAKYVMAESPLEVPADFPQGDRSLLDQIKQDAQRANDGQEVQHVGPIFARLRELFESRDRGLKDEDFGRGTFPFQAKFADWGFEPRSLQAGEKLIIESFEGADITQLRQVAVGAVRKVGEQGEGFDLPQGGAADSESHFERFFFSIYKPFRDLLADPALQLTWPVAENPNTTSLPEQVPPMTRMVEAVREAHASKGRITHARARMWAHLFNLRYRMLLTFLSHFLRLDQQLYDATAGPKLGDRTPRGLLLIWTFNEMRRLKKIAGKLVQLPKDAPPGEVHAGPPFELPYTLNLPDREADRWRVHLDVSRAAARLIREQLQPGSEIDGNDDFLRDVLRSDEQSQAVMQTLVTGGPIPAESLPTDFQKVVSILEEAVRGFTIGAHRNFWRGRTRQQFVTESPHPLVPRPIKENPDGSFDPDGSPLVRRVEHANPKQRMPRFRPPIPEERKQFIRQWIRDGCPDNTNQPGIQGESDPVHESLPPVPPPTDEPLSFAADIRGLFRDFDRESMQMFGGFDLHRYEDVRDRAEDIFARLEDGSMPCDGSWPPDRITKFRTWIVGGKQS